LRGRTARYCSQATLALPRAEHGPMRHLLVLAALGARSASGRRNGLRPVRELYLAWSTARRAARRQ